MFKKSVFTMCLTALLVLGIAAASFADPGKGKGHWNSNGKGKWKVIQLTDVETHWAEQPIRAMGLQGIILGYPDSSFRPEIPVTKFEAIMMISKASGFNGSYDTNRSWDSKVPQWMSECLDYAVSKGILSDSEADGLKGGEPAKRYEVAVWALRAMNLDQYDQLSFQDLNEIPNYARPYVGGMFRHRYMIGYPGNVFQPNKPVTRAELAAVLYRIMLEHPADNIVYRVVKGEVDKVSSSSIEIEGKTYNVTEDSDIFVDGKRAELDDVKVDARVTAYVDQDNRVTLLYARNNGDGDEEDEDDDNNLVLKSLTPADGSDDVDTDTRELVVKFDVEIKAVDDLQSVKEGIRVRNVTDSEDVDIDEVSMDGRDLTIELEDSLKSDKTYRVIIDSNIIEAKDSGWNFKGISGSGWEFSTVDSFKIVELTPRNGVSNVDGANTKVLRARFSSDIEVISGKDLLGAVKVYNKSDNDYVDIHKVEIDEDTLIITLEDTLERGDTFEVTIKADYLEEEHSGDNFEGIASGDWRFSASN